jgi:hypothetical protein
MEPKLTFKKGWLKVWSFLASILQDKVGDTSTKRIVVMGSFILLCRMVEGSMNERTINTDVLYGVCFVILVGIGATIPEWFSVRVKNPNVSVVDNSTANS